MDLDQLPSIVEALILSSPEPLTARRITQVLTDVSVAQVTKAVEALDYRYEQAGASFRVREIAGGFQYYILPDYSGYVDELFTRRRKMRLTRAALESAAIVAYRQPVTKSEIEHIRGVASDAVLQNLLEKNMITIVGRARTIGKPLQYGTTDDFLKFFGLASLEALPRMEEIEEMLAASQSRDQTELELKDELAETALHLKLNVLDGTFDPSSREEIENLDLRSDAESGTSTSVQPLHIRTNPQHEAFQPEADNNMDHPVSTGDRDKGPGNN
jgi:segregation and condensation protein B